MACNIFIQIFLFVIVSKGVQSDGADKFLVERNKQDFVGIHAKKLWNASKSYGELTVSEILEKFYTPEKVHAVSNDDTTIGLLIK